MWKGFIGNDGQQYIAKGKMVSGEEGFMVVAKTRKELLAKLVKVQIELRKAAR